MALTPQVVEDWIKENVCADKDKSTSKKDIWSSFHAGLPFIFIEERANFFSLFGFAIKKFANISVIKRNNNNNNNNHLAVPFIEKTVPRCHLKHLTMLSIQ